jgi:carbamoyl-phosphate synthase large subunit
LSINILVTAVGGGVGQSILRALFTSKLDFRLIGTDVNPWATGLYSCNKGYLISPAGHEAFEQNLVEICASEKIDVLIPGSDPEIPYIAKIAKDLSELGVVCILGSHHSVQICRDKQKAYKFFADKDLPFTKTLRLKNDDDYSQVCDDDFPLIVKPFDGSASMDVHVVFGWDELVKLKNDKQKDYIVQEYLIPEEWSIEKSKLTKEYVISKGRLVQKDEISIQVLIDDKGLPFEIFTSLNSLKDGVPVTIEPKKNLGVDDIAWKMAKQLGAIGLCGPCNLQCRITKNGAKFFEINPRFTGITAVRALLGFNEVEALIRLFYFRESLDKIKDSLNYNEKLLCSRYITEYVFNKKDYEMLRGSKIVEAKGFSNTL